MKEAGRAAQRSILGRHCICLYLIFFGSRSGFDTFLVFPCYSRIYSDCSSGHELSIGESFLSKAELIRPEPRQLRLERFSGSQCEGQLLSDVSVASEETLTIS